jgi:hypothetical protein
LILKEKASKWPKSAPKAKNRKTSKKKLFFSILKGLKFLLNFVLKNIDFNRKSFKMAKIGSRPWPWPWPWPWPRDFQRPKKKKEKKKKKKKK